MSLDKRFHITYHYLSWSHSFNHQDRDFPLASGEPRWKLMKPNPDKYWFKKGQLMVNFKEYGCPHLVELGVLALPVELIGNKPW